MQRIVIGHFGRSYGIKGWLKVNSQTDPVDNILLYRQWQIYHQGLWQTVEISDIKKQGKSIIAKLPQCHTPEEANLYTHDAIAIYRHQMPEPSSDEYYWIDLVGLKVINQQGIDLGTVDHLFSTGANDVLVVKGERRRLMPYIQNVVLAVDLIERKITVDWDPDF